MEETHDRSAVAAMGRLLVELMSRSDTVILSRIDQEYSISATLRGKRTHVEGSTLVEALARITGREAMLICLRCGNTKPISEFVVCREYTSGRKPVCRECERLRWRRDNQRRSAKRKRPAP